MKTPMRPSFLLLPRLFLFLLASALVGQAAPSANGGRVKLELELNREGQTAKVSVPEGVATVTLQRFNREGGWTKVASRDAVPGVMRFKLPATKGKVQWRAIGQVNRKADGSRAKFPASFYQGASEFAPAKSVTGNSGISVLMDRTAGLGGDFNVDAPAPAPGTVEADIWKVDGSTVYFFNQLRGLQVLDLKNPADPRITASLRLPAVGQDLYLLPGVGAIRHLVLLTRNWSEPSGDSTRINLVEVTGGKARITHRRDVPGFLADSRLAGNRLILATTEWNPSLSEKNGGWNSRTRLSEWLVAPGTQPQADGEALVNGDSPIIAAGADWLALAVFPGNRWDVSEVSVFAIRSEGLVRMAPPVRTEGAVPGKFAIQWNNNVLTTISEKNNDADGWSPVTVLENFRAWAPDVIHPAVVEGRLARLRLAEGESLFATRLAGNKAYIVTFLQVDPLFVIDLADPRNPVVAGEIEVPGWSTHIEPLGDLLFTIGWESNTPVASLFDVADPATPALLRRLTLGDSGTYSEALWDEKALRVLPDDGLAMIPLSTYDWKSGASGSVVQLIDIDLKSRDIALRGKINHAFDARRADLLGNAVVSISQRTLVAADVSDRDEPSILSEVALAWPVDRVLEAGDFLLQIEDGAWYGGGAAVCRISPAKETESILAEIDLGKGIVKAADLRDGKLYVLRESVTSGSYPYTRSIGLFDGYQNNSRLSLDIHDASALPALTLLGSRTVSSEDGSTMALNRILWPQPNRPSVVLSQQFSWFRIGLPFIITDHVIAGGETLTLADAAMPVRSAAAVLDFRPYWVPRKAPRLVVFDTTDPANPAPEESVAVGPEGSSFTGVADAADGLIVLGNAHWKDSKSGEWFHTGVALQTARIVEVETTGSPVVRPLVDLPGELFAITELDRKGFLAFTRAVVDDRTSSLQVSACDGYDAFSIGSVEGPAYAAVAAGGRRLFVAAKDGVTPYRLNENGVLVAEPAIEIGWPSDSLRFAGENTLIGGRWNSIFAVDANGANLTKWKFATWNPGIHNAVPAADGDLLVPFGDYGVDRLKR